MWYGKSSFQIYNDVDRAFYESIIFDELDIRFVRFLAKSYKAYSVLEL